MAQGCGCMPEQLLLSHCQCSISLLSFPFLSHGKSMGTVAVEDIFLFLRVCWSVG